ncbi:MAG: energy transducer TonB [Algicola sp.]|nr:energy transducer TonB [Algicola sp.]
MKFKLLLLSSLLSTAVYAETPKIPEPSSKLVESTNFAKPIVRVEPHYPNSALRRGHEGWVNLSFVVEPDGSVSNAFVTDSSGFKDFEGSALKAVNQWKFSPAADQDGNAIQQCVNSLWLSFTIRNGGKPEGASGRFRGRYNDIQAAFDAKDYKKSKQLLIDMSNMRRFSLYEDRQYWQLKGYHAQYTGDDKSALSHFKRASTRVKNSTDEFELTLLSNIFILQLKQNLFVDALSTYQQLEKTKGSEKTLERFKPYQQKIATVIASNKIFSVPSTIGERGFAQYQLARNQFEIGNVQGQVDKIKVFCDNKQNTFSYAADSAWTIPESWGKCSLYVYGSKDTAFNIVELPNNI